MISIPMRMSANPTVPMSLNADSPIPMNFSTAINQRVALSDEAKEALLNCFAHVAWIDEDGQDYYDALYDALYSTPPATLVSISAVYTQSGTVYTTTSLDDLKTDLVVTATYDDSSTATVTTYTLSGTLEVGTSTVTVSYGGKTTTFTVTVSAIPTVSSISAVYTQSGTVYDTDSLDSLKSDLVVTATYSDSSTAVVPSADYTLSGTLANGTSTVTVTYAGKTTTFTVTVTGLPNTYTALDYVTFNGSTYALSGIYESADLYSAEYKYMRTSTANPNYHVFSSTNNYYPFASTDSSDTWKEKFKGDESGGFHYSWSTNTAYTVLTDFINDKIYINGTQVKDGIPVGSTYNSSNQFAIGAYGGSVSTAKYHLIGRIYYLRLFDSNGDAHYFRAAKRNSDSVIGFYDYVTGNFITSASGSFSGGND